MWYQPFAAAWLASVGTFSMFPLLERDGLALPYAVAMLGFHLLVAPASCGGWRCVEAARALSLLGMLAIHAAALCVPAPARYPDAHAYAFAVYSCAHFLGFYCYWLLVQVR